MAFDGIRFTPAMLERWRREKRGTGTGRYYIPWHQVRPADPASRGRSHLINWRFERLHHLLSDNELVAFGLVTMLQGIVDVREQFPLALLEHPFDLTPYCVGQGRRLSAGTLALAEELGIRHPVLRGRGNLVPWVMTTDMVVSMRLDQEPAKILAIAVKEDAALSDDRTLELLRIEREYWLRQDATWLLITPSLLGPGSAESIQGCLPWALGDPNEDLLLDLCRAVPMRMELIDRTWPAAIRHLERSLAVSRDKAQRLLWQCVWIGLLPIDLSDTLRPASKLRLLSEEAFWEQNPIAMRRTAWRS
jgi:hypothetical protein